MILTESRLQRIRAGDKNLSHLVFRCRNFAEHRIEELVDALEENNSVTHIRFEDSIGYKNLLFKLNIPGQSFERRPDVETVVKAIRDIIPHCKALTVLKIDCEISADQAIAIMTEIARNKPANLSRLELQISIVDEAEGARLQAAASAIVETNIREFVINGRENIIGDEDPESADASAPSTYAAVAEQQLRPLESDWQAATREGWHRTYTRLCTAAVQDCLAYYRQEPGKNLTDLYQFLCQRREEIAEQGGFFEEDRVGEKRHRVFGPTSVGSLVFGLLRPTHEKHYKGYQNTTSPSSQEGPYVSIYSDLEALFAANCAPDSADIPTIACQYGGETFTRIYNLTRGRIIRIEHPDGDKIQPLFDAADTAFTALLAAENAEAAKPHLLSILFFYVHAMPTERGNAAITEMLTQVVAGIAGYEFSFDGKLGIDLVAIFNPTVERFIAAVSGSVSLSPIAQAIDHSAAAAAEDSGAAAGPDPADDGDEDKRFKPSS